jgi:hypothetical protein
MHAKLFALAAIRLLIRLLFLRTADGTRWQPHSPPDSADRRAENIGTRWDVGFRISDFGFRILGSNPDSRKRRLT